MSTHSTSGHPQPADLDTLRARVSGTVLGPRDVGYADAAAAWNLAWTHRPAAAVRPAAESDVVAAVTYAASRGLSVVVQATGHGVTVPADESSILIDVADLAHVEVDPDTATATVGGGAVWTPVVAASAAHGLAPLVGSALHVGAVGYSLGGGFGWLGRKHGLAVDRVRALRVVLADGRVVEASPEQSPELFWAMCGAGGGSLGVVVEMTVGLVPVGEVYGGNLMYPLEDAREVGARYLEWAGDNPDELTSAFNITAFPPLEIVPEPLRGRTFAIVRGCHAGGPDEGRRRVDVLRRWREPAIDTWGTLPFSRSAEISQDPVDPVPAASSGRWLRTVDPDVVEVMLDAMTGAQPSSMLFAELRHAGGAINTLKPAVSYGARSVQWSLELVGLVVDAAADADLERRFATVWERTAPLFAAQHGYLNFTEGRERVEMAAKAFTAATWRRLAQAKREYDPTGVFRHGIALDGA